MFSALFICLSVCLRTNSKMETDINMKLHIGHLKYKSKNPIEFGKISIKDGRHLENLLNSSNLLNNSLILSVFSDAVQSFKGNKCRT